MSVCQTFHIVDIPVHGTVTGWLVGVEITFNQEAGYVMLEHAQIAVGAQCGAGGTATIEVNVATDILAGQTVVCPHHVGVLE